MSEIRSGYIQRKHLANAITYAIEDAAKKPVPMDAENQSYELGRALGFTDGLKHAKQLLEQLYDDPRPAPRGPWHHSIKG